MENTVLTFGTYDLLHRGYINILQRAANLGTKLIVGVSSDNLNFSKKQKHTIFNQSDRQLLVRSLKCVDEVFLEESLEKKREYIMKYQADILVMGDDWEGKFDEFNDICQVIYLPRTRDISTTDIINQIRTKKPAFVEL